MPIGVAKRLSADGVEPGHLLLAEGQLGRGQVVCELFGRACSDDDRGDRRLRNEVGEGDLGRRDAAAAPISISVSIVS